MSAYRPAAIEKKWQRFWETRSVYRQYGRKKKFYVLDMFPYPSGAGLHVGHPRGYIATDVVARTKQLQGYGILHPMGWDAFGLPAEQFAIKNKLHPSIATKKNIAYFKKQLAKIGFTYDWEREINTTDPAYYRWTQWIFLQLWKKGLAYESHEPINWCPSCQTGLANEDLEDGKCERCGSVVEQRPMRQWVLKMTAYADRLLADLDSPALEWPESIKDQQRHWIGRSEGTIVKFFIKGTEEEIEVFTTRLDTIYGCTYVVLAPEHPLIRNQVLGIKNQTEIRKYIESVKKKTEMDRLDATKEKTGVRLEGVEAINPFTSEAVPVYVADYVLGHYGTGAVMAVPAHDERDWDFADKNNISKPSVIDPVSKGSISTDSVYPVFAPHVLPDETIENATARWKAQEYILVKEGKRCFIMDGVLKNSNQFSGLTSAEAREKMTQWLEKEGLGRRQVNYRMRDWVFSRQRYWGEPIPLVHCERCGVVPVPEKDLPVKLPNVKSYEPTGTGESPLATIDKWVKTKCPTCGGPARRETNTMPQWAGSCWYYLRYIDPKNRKALVDKKKEKKLMPVDVYVGGTEHATRHLLYARFWHKFLYDIKVVSGKEPFKRLANQGLILASDGRKMSKRWGNVINPDDLVGDFGADAFRLYEMFMGPFGQAINWNTDGVVGMRRFLEKTWKLADHATRSRSQATNKAVETLLHQTVKKVTDDLEGFRFNTAVSALMILANTFEKQEALPARQFKTFLLLLSPFAPHIAEELWHRMGERRSIFLAKWPQADPKLLVSDEVKIVIQVNGKLRGEIMIARDVDQSTIERLALDLPAVVMHTAGKTLRKTIHVPGRLVNFVVS